MKYSCWLEFSVFHKSYLTFFLFFLPHVQTAQFHLTSLQSQCNMCSKRVKGSSESSLSFWPSAESLALLGQKSDLVSLTGSEFSFYDSLLYLSSEGPSDITSSRGCSGNEVCVFDSIHSFCSVNKTGTMMMSIVKILLFQHDKYILMSS